MEWQQKKDLENRAQTAYLMADAQVKELEKPGSGAQPNEIADAKVKRDALLSVFHKAVGIEQPPKPTKTGPGAGIINQADENEKAKAVVKDVDALKDRDAVIKWRNNHPESTLTDQQIVDQIINPIKGVPGFVDSMTGTTFNQKAFSTLANMYPPYMLKGLYDYYQNVKKKEDLAR
jgi:hypothetical protein